MLISQELDALASSQHGLLTREQIVKDGGGRLARSLVSSGTALVVRTGVYRLVGSPVTYIQRLMAAQLGHPECVISHTSALLLLAAFPANEVEITMRLGTAMPGVVVHRSRTRPESVIVSGLEVTSPERTLIDLAASLPVTMFERRLEIALDRRIATPASVIRHLEELGPGRRGSRRLREALDSYSDDGGTSALEREVFQRLMAQRLPRSIPQHRVTTSSGSIYVLDFAWPERMLALEVDGFAFHGGRTSFDTDRRRDRELTADGWRVLRATSRTDLDELTVLLRRLLTR